MENQFFLNGGMSHRPIHFETSSMPTWHPLSSSALEIQPTVLNCSPDQQTQDCFYNNPATTDHGLNFDSALSSMVSSPAASNSNIQNDNFVIRELIGKLGAIGSSGEISPHSQPLAVPSSYNNNNNNTSSCYSSPLNSPPKLNISQVMNHLVKENNMPSLGGKPSSMALNSTVAEFSADPGFAERAAKFSCFGSRSFNGRTSQLVVNNNTAELTQRSNAPVVIENGKLPRVSSSPSLKTLGSQMGATMENKGSSPLQERMEVANSQEESTISEQTPNGEAGVKPSPDMNSRKRKASSKGKAKETSISTKVSTF